MSLKLEDIRQLANTSRIDISDDELKGLLSDLESILVYINQIDKTVLPDGDYFIPDNYNVSREDIVTTLSGENTDILLAQAVGRQDNYVKVKKIL